MTPEQLAALLARAVPEMLWTVDGEIVRNELTSIQAVWGRLGYEIRVRVIPDLNQFEYRVSTHTRDGEGTHTLRPEQPILEALAMAVGGLLPDADRATWAAPLHARAEVLRAERTVTEHREAMDAAIKAWQDSVSALRSAQAHLEAVQDG